MLSTYCPLRLQGVRKATGRWDQKARQELETSCGLQRVRKGFPKECLLSWTALRTIKLQASADDQGLGQQGQNRSGQLTFTEPWMTDTATKGRHGGRGISRKCHGPPKPMRGLTRGTTYITRGVGNALCKQSLYVHKIQLNPGLLLGLHSGSPGNGAVLCCQHHWPCGWVLGVRRSWQMASEFGAN